MLEKNCTDGLVDVAKRDFLRALFFPRLSAALKTVGKASGDRQVERVLLIWIVDRLVRTFLNSPGCGFLVDEREHLHAGKKR